jgi:hypothetical protein
MESNMITVKELKEYMSEHYGYISYLSSDKEIEKWLKDRNPKTIRQAADLFSDFVLANGYHDEVQL